MGRLLKRPLKGWQQIKGCFNSFGTCSKNLNFYACDVPQTLKSRFFVQVIDEVNGRCLANPLPTVRQRTYRPPLRVPNGVMTLPQASLPELRKLLP